MEFVIKTAMRLYTPVFKGLIKYCSQMERRSLPTSRFQTVCNNMSTYTVTASVPTIIIKQRTWMLHSVTYN